MRYLVFSDSHLTEQFDPKKLTVLKQAITDADRVIINGDFWDGFSTTFDEFVSSKWKDTLFPLLKKKKAVYIYGNHDQREYADKRTSLFCAEEGPHYDIQSGDKFFHFEHGNRLVPLFDEWFKTRIPPSLNNAYEAVEGFMVRIFGNRYMQTMYGKFNKLAVGKLKHEKGLKGYFVMGHTHLKALDHMTKFINTGFIKHGLAQYIYIEDGTITQVEKKY